MDTRKSMTAFVSSHIVLDRSIKLLLARLRTFGKENTRRAIGKDREQADLLVVLHFTFLFSLDRAITPFRTQE